jgi:hypothetical protein
VPKEQSAMAVAISPATTTSRGSSTSALPRRYRWRPTFWRVRPLIGVMALLTAIICLLVSLAILKASDGDPTNSWSFQPTVYLAIATAISNAALQCALSQAAPISWWYKALQGRAVKDLELDWEAGYANRCRFKLHGCHVPLHQTCGFSFFTTSNADELGT